MDESIIKNFLDKEGKVKAFPAKRSKLLEIVKYIAADFSPLKEYSEQQVNEIISNRLAVEDYVTVRRELIDNGFLTRENDGSIYKVITK